MGLISFAYKCYVGGHGGISYALGCGIKCERLCVVVAVMVEFFL